MNRRKKGGGKRLGIITQMLADSPLELGNVVGVRKSRLGKGIPDS